ncbi:PD-(D/E)XK nuclease family protein [uncultured Fusobacterium sp.]|jgi:ribosomal protein S18|uniref:PDDEXK-like family protein n=1 Tax=uncultured Fusobacterium sp. TaxID=159267 RepID=UPI0025EDB2A2|nr:PD-(D/E)XK nuclease family protein [uncultured Fusobacterium sp.]
MENYKIFLENLSLISRKYKIINSTKETFNIFSILRNEYDEVNLHSKFITELLKDKNYGRKFIELLLPIIGVEKINYKRVNIFSEYSIKDNGRIDIILKFFLEDNKKVIVIENKIYADDQYQQLKRYYDSMLMEGYKSEEIELVYLTLAGAEPSEDSIKGLPAAVRENMRIISYKDDIITWIEDCIKEVAQVPIIRETLVQYESLLKKITGKGERIMTEEMKNMILSNKDYLDMVYKLTDVLVKIKQELQLKFWEKLEEKLNNSLNLQLEKRLEYPNHHYSENLIEKFYTNSRNNRFYGLMYFIKDLENRGKLYLRIEVSDNLYFGFRIINNEGNSTTNKKDDYLEKELLDLKFSRTDWWLGWKYFCSSELQNQFINFKELDSNLANVLRDNKKLERLTSEIEEELLEKLTILNLLNQ